MQEIQFDYFRGMEAEQYSFYRVPKVLFTAECFKSLSCEAKVLYGLMLDRMSLSIKNRWFDEEDRVYIIFTVEEIAELLNCGTQKAVKLMKELDSNQGIGLIEKKRLGLGKPNVIYVKNFMLKDLATLKDIVNERLLGRTVMDIHYKLRTEIPQILQKYFTVTDNVLNLFDYIFADLFKELVFVAGKVHSLDYASLETYRFLDDKQRVALALRSSMKEGEVASVQVADSEEAALSNVTVLTHRFLIPYRGFGLLSLIGPIDMDYRRSVSLINVIGRVLAMKLGDYYRYLNSNHYEVN